MSALQRWVFQTALSHHTC